MPKITFIDYQGSETIVDASIGSSVMEAATQNDVPGIDADCGGACACATCHIYVNEDWLGKIGEQDKQEADMLEMSEDVKSNSRLACQIPVTEDLDGLIVTTPESQF